MRKLLLVLSIVFLLITPVRALELEPPQVPESAEDLMPVQIETFGQGLWKVIRNAVRHLQPEIASACKLCVSVIAVIMLTSVLQGATKNGNHVLELVSALGIAGALIKSSNSMIHLAAQTVTELSEYGKLLLPVLTAALAAQGGTTTSASLYVGTMVFDTVICAAIANLMVPLCTLFLILAIANSAIVDEMLKKIRDFIKWLMTWALKIALYIFTGYMGITGVVSGTADAAAMKVTKMTISGMVPVVGGILSDASESLIVGAEAVKNAAGVYGILAIIAVWILPFLKIGIQYLHLKGTGALCSVFGIKRASELVQDFSAAMGLLLAMTGSVCALQLISTVCFMKGVS